MKLIMKGNLFISFDETLNEPNYEIQSGYDCYNSDFEIGITTNFYKNIVDTLTLTDELKQEIIKQKNLICSINEDDEFDLPYEGLVVLENNINNNNINNLIDAIDMIFIHTNFNNVIKYIENNSVLKNKKIVIDGTFSLERKKVEEVQHIFRDYSNIYIRLDGNEMPVKFEEAIKTIDIIDKMVEKIKVHNFSPIEQIMYAYDLVRDKIYKDDETVASSDLTSVLLGNNIICKGYSNIFDKILKKLGIKTSFYQLDGISDTNGHMRNIVYVKDDKYNIDGVYFFDTTWNSKKADSNCNFLNSYKFFAKTKKYFDKYNKYSNLKDYTLNYFNDNMVWEVEDLLNEGGYANIPSDYARTINKISKFIDGGQINLPIIFNFMSKSLIPSCDLKNEFIIEKLCEYTELFDKELGADTLLEVLYNVRKCQYYENPEKYPFDINMFRLVVINSGWSFEENDSILNLFAELGLDSSNSRGNISKMDEYIDNNDLERKVERIKLTKTLRRVYEKKSLKR